MYYLKQSTAVVVQFGPFVDKTDGVTLETGLVSSLDHASTGIFLSKNGGTLTIRHATVTASSYDAYGCYKVTLDTTDTNTCGTLKMVFSEAATCLPVWMDFTVVEEEVYDDLFAASAVGYLKPTTAGRDLDVSAGGEAGVDWANVGTPGSTVALSATTVATVTTTTTATNLTNAPTNGDLTSTMKSSVTAAVLDVDMTAHQTQGTLGQAIGDPAADTNTIFKAVVTDATGATVGVDVVAVQADTDDIQTRIPAALTANGNMKSSLVEILTTALTETVGQLAGGFKKFFNIAAPASTMDVLARVTLTDTVTTYTGNTPQTGDVFPLASTEIADIKAKTDLIPAAPAAVGDIPTAAEIADAVHDEVVEGTTTLRQSIRLANSANAGKTDGFVSGTAGTGHVRDLADTKDRITATVDENGNRTDITVDVS